MQIQYFLSRSSLIIIWLIVSICIAGCVSDQCETVSNPELRIAFTKFTNPEQTKEEALSVVFTHIYGLDVTPKKDSIAKDSLVRSTAAIAGLRVPLSQRKDTSIFIFKRQSLSNDTIIFTYTRKPYFISQACGFEMEYENISVLSHSTRNIESVRVTQPSVNAQTYDVNVKIYFTR